MKTLTLPLLLCCAIICIAATHDFSGLEEKVTNLEERVQNLETWADEMYEWAETVSAKDVHTPHERPTKSRAGKLHRRLWEEYLKRRIRYERSH